ncbi:histone H2B.1, sperm-like [Anomaloglossus baeobatrachus]|uniref:histone H2B.1, sperm-like n=1 Tax=Anomaloglossus baeobatrachus TaxID=238106 RepID=UPI003F5096F4
MARGSGRRRRGGRRRSGAMVGPSTNHRPASFNSYIVGILRQVQPGSQISAGAVDAMSAVVNFLLDWIASRAEHLTSNGRRRTLTQTDIQTATCLLLPEALATYAISAADNAVAAYNLQRRHQ